MSTLIFFPILGFVIGYFSTRIFFSPIFQRVGSITRVESRFTVPKELKRSVNPVEFNKVISVSLSSQDKAKMVSKEQHKIPEKIANTGFNKLKALNSVVAWANLIYGFKTTRKPLKVIEQH